MKIKDKEMRKLQEYLTGEMNNDEKELFYFEIKNNPSLQEFLDIYEQIDSFNSQDKWNIYQGDKSLLKETVFLFKQDDVKEFSNKIKFVKNKKNYLSLKRNNRFNFIAFAGIVACSVVLFFTFIFQQPDNLNNYFIENSKWDNLPSFTIKGDSLNGQKIDLEELFLNKEYEKVISLSTEIQNSSKYVDPDILIYKGIALLETNQYKLSLEVFDLLISKKNLIDYHKGYWYKSLVYFKMNNLPKAIETLNIIASNRDFFQHNKATKILEQLEGVSK